MAPRHQGGTGKGLRQLHRLWKVSSRGRRSSWTNTGRGAGRGCSQHLERGARSRRGGLVQQVEGRPPVRQLAMLGWAGNGGRQCQDLDRPGAADHGRTMDGRTDGWIGVMTGRNDLQRESCASFFF